MSGFDGDLTAVVHERTANRCNHVRTARKARESLAFSGPSLSTVSSPGHSESTLSSFDGANAGGRKTAKKAYCHMKYPPVRRVFTAQSEGRFFHSFIGDLSLELSTKSWYAAPSAWFYFGRKPSLPVSGQRLGTLR